MIRRDNNLATIKKTGDADERISKADFEFRVRELKRCKEDITYFAETYFRIISLKDGLVIIKPYPKQAEFLRFIKDTKRVICLSSRQSGKTTTYTIYCLWLLCFYPTKAIMIAANKASTAIEIMGRVRLAYEYLPLWLKPAIVTYNKSEVVYSNNAKIHAFATSSDACRGFSAGYVILDEFAYVPKNVAESFFSSVYPVVSTDPNSHVIIVSTANTAIDNMYYDIWQQALNADKTDPDQWQAFRMDWWEVPGRDEKWKRDQIASIGIERFRVEFGNEFRSEAHSRLLPDAVIEYHRKHTKVPNHLILKSSTGNNDWVVNVYHRFELGHVYVAGADIAEGVGGDASTLIVLDITDMTDIKVALVFKSSAISITEFAALTARVLNAYALPLLLAENNGVGAGYLSTLNETYNYPKILSYNETSLGIHASNKNKLEACLWLRELLTSEELKFTLYDDALLNELSVFSKSSQSGAVNYSAPRKLKDDLTLALIWAVFLIKPQLLQFGVNVIKTVKTKLGVEIPSVISYDVGSVINLPAFAGDQLPRVIATMLGDVEAAWFTPETASDITTSLMIFEPIFLVHTSGTITDTYDEDEDDGPSW